MSRRSKALALALLLLAQPTSSILAANVTWPQATSLVLPGTGITLTIDASSQADTLTVNPSSFTVDVANGETFTVRYPGPSYGTMTNDGSIDDCNIVSSDNVSVVNGPKTVTFTPSTTTCADAVAPAAGSGASTPPSIRLYAPNGGEKIVGGAAYRVFWTYTGSQGRSVALSLSLNDGNFEPIATSLDLASGYYNLTMPTPANDSAAKLRAQLLGDGRTVLAFDDSDASFTIDVEDQVAPPLPPPTPDAEGMPEAYDPHATIDGDKTLQETAAPLGAFCQEKKLIKLADDGNPATQHDSAVYYCGRDGKRYGFPNAKIYATWYEDFSSVRVITAEEMAALPLGGNVTYRPGSRLVKIQSDPKTYAVGRDGLLRHVPDEATAIALFGASWSKLVDDIDVAFFLNYRIGAPIPSRVP
jgi:hypothetical protein